MSRWWRAYDEAVDDPKLQRLGPALGWAWFNLMCIASKHGGALPPIGDIAFKLRVTEQRAAATLTALVTAGLFERAEDGAFAPHNWEGRQFRSDVSNDRVKRYRQRQRNVTQTVTVTPPETEQRQSTEAETDKTSLRSEPAPAKAVRRSSAKAALPSCWQLGADDRAHAVSLHFAPDKIRLMAAAFADHHRSKGSLMADWHAAWRTWCGNEIKFARPNGHGPPRRDNPSFAELAKQLTGNDHEPAHEPSLDLDSGPIIEH